jgi:hypothetical protein
VPKVARQRRGEEISSWRNDSQRGTEKATVLEIRGVTIVKSRLHSKCLGQAKKGRKLVPDTDDRQGYSFKMSIAATSQRWIEFFSTILGAVIALILIPHTSGVLLLFGAILVAFYRLLRSTR